MIYSKKNNLYSDSKNVYDKKTNLDKNSSNSFDNKNYFKSRQYKDDFKRTDDERFFKS